MISDRQIFEAALKTWNRHGISRATLRRIAIAAEVGEMTLLRRFASKPTLMKAALTWQLDRFTNSLSRSGDLAVDLVAIIEGYDKFAGPYERLVAEVILDAENAELKPLMPLLTDAFFRVRQIVFSYQTSGELTGNDPHDALLSLIAPILFRRHRHKARQSHFSKEHLDSFLRGWGSTSPGLKQGIVTLSSP